ncbi:hypothetical protein M0R45_015915 [Rubus argutus]|uniref:Uncharacterized protein n=1 Tax=Rubus argutus TaxID=59490 RepID=A0AAW1XTG4_RUBAR
MPNPCSTSINPINSPQITSLNHKTAQPVAFAYNQNCKPVLDSKTPTPSPALDVSVSTVDVPRRRLHVSAASQNAAAITQTKPACLCSVSIDCSH